MYATRKNLVGLAVAMFGSAALLGGWLGIAIAADDLPKGPAFVGGPFEQMTPAKFTSCLPASSWNSIYVWDSTSQQWTHYVNPNVAPAYVNDPKVGGITNIPKLSGVAIILDSAVNQATFPRLNSQTCP